MTDVLTFNPALRSAAFDRRLTSTDTRALLVMWQELSPAEWKPMKAEVLAQHLRIGRPNAARAIRHLVTLGYLQCCQPDPRAPRLFLLANIPPTRQKAA